MMEKLHEFIYGILISVAAILGVLYVIMDKREAIAEKRAREAETKNKLNELEAHNATTPLDELVKEFDAELDADKRDVNKPKGGS